ncbi:hypothetical protein CTEN210_01610 [Chaetoceros tenuissimus]|uniref:Uncharacterized protein n=1 Tax=Chaetoceros tenuissimus TaxID=426638 RepID=A0AAD3GZW4_9STRA|nr:hypothetical protein CTEN210_01610 [Chaetoceros tenuissimus]
MSDTNNKKRKADASSTSSKSSKKSSKSKSKSSTLDNFSPYTLEEIRQNITQLADKVPAVPDEGIDPLNNKEVRAWAAQMQAIIEEFNLLLCCVSSATYRWGTDRSGAADQHLGLLSSELGNAQDQISTSVTPRLSNVLAPVVDLVTKESITTTREMDAKDVEKWIEDNKSNWENYYDGYVPSPQETESKKNGNKIETSVKTTKIGDGKVKVEQKINYFAQEENDPAFIRLCSLILSRNATMLKHVLLTNFQKVGKCIDDYLKATKKDGQSQRNAFAY